MTIVQNKLMSKGILLTLVMFICISVAGCASDSVNYLSRGTACAKKGEFDRAISNYDKAVLRDPENAKIYANRGYVYFLKGEYDRAISDHSTAIKVNPKYAKAYRSRAAAYCMTGEYGKAWEDVHNAQNLGHPVQPEFIRSLKILSEASGRGK